LSFCLSRYISGEERNLFRILLTGTIITDSLHKIITGAEGFFINVIKQGENVMNLKNCVELSMEADSSLQKRRGHNEWPLLANPAN